MKASVNTVSHTRSKGGQGWIGRRMTQFHVTPAIVWTIGGTLVSGLTGPVVAFLIAHKFSPEMQGYYYTFSSLLAMSVFLELGFNGCIVQFISHEYAHLGMENGRLNQSSPRILGRLASLVRLSLKWYIVAAFLMLVGVGMAGELFFKYNPTFELIYWRGPWWCLCVLSALNLMILPLGALLDGCDQVNWTARARIIQNFGRSFVLIGGLLLGLGLYAPVLAALCGLLVFVLQFSAKWRILFTQILICPVEEKISWVKEILPMQWRIAVSWASGYFIFSLFNPLLFAYAGAKVAGKFGMTWAILAAISGISQVFMSTRAPRFGGLIAKGEWGALKSLWRMGLAQSLGVNIVGVTVFIGGVLVLSVLEHPFRDRLIGLLPIILLSLAGLLNQFVFGVATLVRAEKREPFLWPSIFVALTVFFVCIMLIPALGVVAVGISYLAGALLAVLFAVFIFRSACLIRLSRTERAGV